MLGIVIVGLAGVGVLTAGGVDGLGGRAGTAVAERGLETFAADLQSVAVRDRTGPVPVDVRTGGPMVVDESDGWIAISVGTERVYAGPLGVIEADRATGRYGVQAGAVFREAGDGSVAIVASPPFAVHAEPPTVSFPVVVLTGAEVLGHRVFIERVEVIDGFPERVVPNDAAIEIAVEGRYYRGWERVFERLSGESDATVSVVDDARRASLRFPPGQPRYLHVVVYRVRVTTG